MGYSDCAWRQSQGLSGDIDNIRDTLIEFNSTATSRSPSSQGRAFQDLSEGVTVEVPLHQNSDINAAHPIFVTHGSRKPRPDTR